MNRSQHAVATLVALFASGTAAAQIIPLTPLPRTLDLLVVDSTADRVWRLSDFNQNGDLNDGPDISVYYDDTIGTVALTNPSCIAQDGLGTTYVGDSTVDVILAMRDGNDDGDAHDVGEHRVFFTSGTNASGLVMASVQGLTVDLLGVVYVAVSNAGSTGTDVILRLNDLNGDGDADDVGEASEYCAIPNAQVAVGDSIPTEVVVGPDFKLYYVDMGVTGAVTKGVWQLDDLNFDGDCNDPGEINLFWAPTAAGNAFYWGLAVDRTGRFYITDHGNEQVWTARDTDGSGVIDIGEEQLFYQTSASTYWDVVLRDDGAVILCEDQSPDRLVALIDGNGDGDALDPGEATEIYSDIVSPTDLRPRGAVFMAGPVLRAPSTVPISQSLSLDVTAPRPGAFVFLALSAPAASTGLPPFGTLELDLNGAETLALGIADAQGQYNLTIPIPNNPQLVGTVAFQSLAGDLFRPYLSNGSVVSITL